MGEAGGEREHKSNGKPSGAFLLSPQTALADSRAGEGLLTARLYVRVRGVACAAGALGRRGGRRAHGLLGRYAWAIAGARALFCLAAADSGQAGMQAGRSPGSRLARVGVCAVERKGGQVGGMHSGGLSREVDAAGGSRCLFSSEWLQQQHQRLTTCAFPEILRKARGCFRKWTG